jgi:hypothetical protein
MTHDGLEQCQECGYAYDPEDGPCQNPACFKGLAKYRAAVKTWEDACEESIRALTGRRTAYNLRAMRENYARIHPQPTIAAFKPANATLEVSKWPDNEWNRL